MPKLLQFYGFDIKRGRMKCPLHNGEDYNCGVKQEYIHCFVCGESADVISFVIKYYGLSFKEAITKLNNDFHLGLPIGEKLDRRKQLDMAKRSFKARQEISGKVKYFSPINSRSFPTFSQILEIMPFILGIWLFCEMIKEITVSFISWFKILMPFPTFAEVITAGILHSTAL